MYNYFHNKSVSTTPSNNEILYQAQTLISLMSQLNLSDKSYEIPQLRSQLINEINIFKDNLSKAGYSKKIVLASCYCICTALDEFILRHNWAMNSDWAQQSLLSIFYNESSGGEKIYLIIDELAKNHQDNIDFLELSYLLLSLGFEGKYFGNKILIREEIRSDLINKIKQVRPKVELRLLCHSKSKVYFYLKPYNLILIITAITLIATNIFYNYKLHSQSMPYFSHITTLKNNLTIKRD